MKTDTPIKAIRAYLFCPDGTYRSLWLSLGMEGRYYFLDRLGKTDLPFYAEKSGDRWVLFCSSSGVFFAVDNHSGQKINKGCTVELVDQQLIWIQYQGEVFRVYAEYEREGDYLFLPYYLEPWHEDYSIGRQKDAMICHPNAATSRHHAALHWNKQQWEIIDQDSTCGVYVNGTRVVKKNGDAVAKKELSPGDTVFIMGLFIIMGVGYIVMNNGNDRVTINTPHIRQITHIDERSIKFSETGEDKGEDKLFDRPPRRLIKLESETIEIEMPPMKMGSNKLPLMLRLGTPMLMGGQAIFSGNYLMALTSMVMPTLTQGLTEKDRKEYEEKRLVKYRNYLSAKEEEIKKEVIREVSVLNEAHPSLKEVCTFTIDQRRLWERRKMDEDFLNIRVGNGMLPLIAERQYNKKRFELDEDCLEDEMYELAEKPFRLENVPITVSLTEDFVVGIQGDCGKIAEFLKNMILQLAMTHSYDELKICVLATEEYAEKLDFVRYLPHNWADDRSIRFFAASQSDTLPIANYFKTIEEKIFDEKSPAFKKNIANRSIPCFAVFALDKTLFESMEVMKSVIGEQEYRGISILASFDGIPKECSKIFDLKSPLRIIDLKHSEKPDAVFELDEYDPALVKESLRILNYTKLKINSELYSLPSMMTFLEMCGVGKVEHLNPLNRWAENNPVKSLSVPVGVGTDGNLFALDLHEKKQGPHGLIAGMTGSGKSEFIITYILSMAVNFSPEEVAFILIDYKGGGLTDAFEDKARGIHLPHVVGTITNLDGSAIQRSLMSINSELKRRQTVFKQAKSETNEGTMDIYDYQRLYRTHKVKEPMPHLFIISDEFAELKKQQPEFMDELISTARIGRSLGVHLILATQKPGGVVNDQIWSNTKFRVCLRVQDRSDSMEMLKRPEAAELKHTGRFYLQVGYNEYFAMGQSAWCGAGYIPQDEITVEKDDSVYFIDKPGQTIHRAKPKTQKRTAESKQIVAIVKYLSDLAVREKIQTRPLWLDPLPEKIEYHSIPLLDSDCVQATIGMVDDPEYQKQFPLVLDLHKFHHMLLVGGSGSGKSTFLRTLLYSTVTRYSPEDVYYYILDLSSGALSGYANMPHCGAYVNEEMESDFDRMMKLVEDTVTERKKMFAEAEVFGYESYCEIKKLPRVLVVLDGWSNVKNFQKGRDYELSIHERMREAANYGIHYLLTVNHINEMSAKGKIEADYHIILCPKDKFDYNDVLNVRGSMLPPQTEGRGVCVIDGRPLEYQVAIPNAAESDQRQNALLKQKAVELNDRYAGRTAVRKLAMLEDNVAYAEFCDRFEKDRIPLGFSMDSMNEICIPLQQLYTAGIFFGNQLGIRPVITNLVHAFYRENADIIIVRRLAGTVFDRKAETGLRQMFGERCAILNATVEDADALDVMIVNNIQTTKAEHRDRYCEENGIPATDRGRTRKAAKYIRAHSRPLIVLFESFADFIRLQTEQNLKDEFSVLFSQIKGYNVYFFGCFYPEDESMSNDPLFKAFAKEDFAMLFGGRFHNQWITSLPSQYKKMESVNPNYNRFIMKYRNETYRMLMPCGELVTSSADPDEAEII